MDVLAPVATNGISPPEVPQTTEPEVILKHLSDVLQVTLGAARRELEAVGSLLSKAKEADSLSRCTRFASELQEAIYAQKDIVEDVIEDESINGEASNGYSKSFAYTLSSEPSLASTTVASVAFLKSPSPLDPRLPLPSQLQVVTLPVLASVGHPSRSQGQSGAPYERLHSLVHLALAPYFDAYTSGQTLGNGYKSRSDPDGKGGVPGAKKKITELENILRHLEQNVEIPALHLPLHDLVQEVLAHAEADNVPPSLELMPRGTLADSRFLNSLHNNVNGWIKSIQAITKMSRDPECETAAQEINFWLSMESALGGIEEQLRQDGVLLTMDILKQAKRYQATLSFQADTGLKEGLDLVQKYNILMHDFPLDDLLGATSLETVEESLNVIFQHLNKKLRLSPYPIRRALALVEAISGDLNSQVRRLLNGRTLMRLEYTEFTEVISATNSIWHVWDDNLKDFTNVARDVTRRRNDKFIPIKIAPRHIDTLERLKYVTTFRNNHEQLQKTIISVLGSQPSGSATANGRVKNPSVFVDEGSDIDAVSEVSEAYLGVQHVDVLDTSREGTQLWVQAETLYNERTARVENSIIARLRDRLATARSANGMFRVFSKFNALLVRPKVRGAISEYQAQLLESVKKDITALHERFKLQYSSSEASLMLRLRDVPPVAGSIIWVRQIEKQLDGYMDKVKDVLGEDWNLHADGEKLQNESALFRKKLQTYHLYEAWVHEVQNRKLAINGRLFKVVRNRAAGNRYELGVNFDSQVIILFKEVRNLAWLKFQVPHAITTISREARRVYPYAISLMDSARSYIQTTNTISRIPDIAPLLHGYQKETQRLISQGLPLRWDSFVHSYGIFMGNTSQHEGGLPSRPESMHARYVQDLAQSISTLQSKTSTLSSIYESVQSGVSDLRSCPFAYADLHAMLDNIQVAVDKLNLENYANLDAWVERLNRDVEVILRERLQDALRLWTAGFMTSSDEPEESRTNEDFAVDPQQIPTFPRLSHELITQNQLIYLDPPLEYARSSWLQHLDSWLGTVCNLERIRSTRYQLSAVARDHNQLMDRFNTIPLHCMDDLQKTNQVIEERVSGISSYLEEWFRYQSLWDLQSEQVFDDMGEDLNQWHQLLLQIRQARSTFDTSRGSKTFGNVTIVYDQVQTKIAAKYDQWQREVTTRFGSRLGTRMHEVHIDIQALREELEGQGLEASSTAQAVAFITLVQKCTRKAQSWEPEVETFRQGQTTLTRQRYQFPADWLHIDQVQHQWDMFKDNLDRKAKIIDDQTDSLRDRIIREDQAIKSKVSDAISQWNEEKPVSGGTRPDVASSVLSAARLRLERLRLESETVSKAKESFDLPDTREKRIESVLEEVNDFTTVWTALSTIWQDINDLRGSLWSGLQTRKLRQSVEGLIKMTKEMPSRMRQYAAFEDVQNVLKQLLKVNPLLTDLKSEAVRERHWVKIFKTLKPGKRYSEVSLTVGDVWDLQLITTEAIVRDIVAQARGEMALEEFVKQVRDTWQNYALELVIYQNKCRLIRGWDDLFTKSSENLNSLQAMRHSPYYKEFEEEAAGWEDKLNRVHVLFDIWIDVQRQWVYLEGVFTGSTDIKHLLPTESMRFQNINSEFFALMKKVNKSPFVLDVLAIPSVQKSLERLADLLGKIQKALGEYLERERMSFPRFYFVGDEDLLEIIGNSNDTIRVAKHFKKMFAGLSGLATNEAGAITGVTSKEGETLILSKEVSPVKMPKINDWLAALETSLKHTLASMLHEAVSEFSPLMTDTVEVPAFDDYLAKYPAQIVVLATQIVWTKLVETSLENRGQGLDDVFQAEIRLLDLLAATVLKDLDAISRKKCEHLITEFVHQRDVIGRLIKSRASSSNYYLWLLQMRYVYNADETDPLQRLKIHMANAKLDYGYEYLGVAERLVRTPLTDRCFLTLTQAMSQRLGGSPYGPAGTGKTESVKALGLQLGRFTLVFCCDDTFDFQAMGRIFLGICQVGAWGCFDEFNRLEERILSAVSQQIQNIQIGLRQGEDDPNSQSELAGRRFRVNPNTGIFITMNPGYAGRSNLPDNLKKLFRSVAMSKPDKELITEVMLFSQGFRSAKELATRTVPFFDHCAAQLTKQAHYDFGLRALKSVLISSGGLKRTRIMDGSGETDSNETVIEPQIIVQSIRETIAPKLIREDAETLLGIQARDFPGVEYVAADVERLTTPIQQIAKDRNFTTSDAWMTKILQLYQIQKIHHGVMMVGNSGSGKSSIWKVLLQALHAMEGVEGVYHVIDPKVMSKESLYGSLDSTTREWTDGLFTGILRKIVDNLRGEDAKRHWIVFDGDVDPEWVENLNSVLDDNKLLTLPNGERLSIPPNVRIMFEVESLKHATLATVSRCGMVWFSDDTVTSSMILENYLQGLKSMTFDELDDEATSGPGTSTSISSTQAALADVLRQSVTHQDFIMRALTKASEYSHIMEFTDIRALNSLFGLFGKICRMVLEYNIQHPDFPLGDEQTEAFVTRKMLLAVVWAFTGDCPLPDRKDFGYHLSNLTNVELPSLDEAASMVDFDVALPHGQWVTWQTQVPMVEVNTHSVTQTDVIIPTVDTIRHEDVLYSWLAEHKPLLLCGPPGSGKTMTLFSALRKLPNMEVVGLNFSSATTPDLIIKTFDQYCEYRKTLNGTILSPTQIGRWLVIFCDEINLPAPDRYATQRAISFLRQLVEQNGFWSTTTKTWVTLDRIQFVGACNPPTDAGRHALGTRFLRHAPLIMVDYPGEQSLVQIYGTFVSAILKITPLLRGYAGALTKAMVQFYSESQARFTAKIQPHYVYSPRELTRWVRGVYEAIKPLEHLPIEGLVRIWAHEALRLFQDRLVMEDERIWTADLVRQVASEHFPSIDLDNALHGPILFSNWLSKNYVSVDQEQLREFVRARLRTFCEEEVDVPLVLFNDVLEHALRIDRVFRQPQGHLILIGVSGSGKTTLSRFVAWMNGLKIFQIKVHGRYSAEDFDEDLRGVLRACGCRGEKICFIMDESNVLDSGFLERMNTLLANGEVPGLFEGDEHSALMTACKEGAQRQGLLLDSPEELYKWFTQQIVQNLHVVFTMNPPKDGLSSKAATSPALFNRCVLNWMGDWSDQALYQVGLELTQSIDLDKQNYTPPDSVSLSFPGIPLPISHRDAIINAMVFVHSSIRELNTRVVKQSGRVTFLTPRHFLDFVAQYVKLFSEKRESLEEQQRHLNVGLEKLRDTVDKVRDLRRSLAQKKEQLQRKDAEANEKLQRMVADQREAETRKKASLEIQTALERQDREVAQRREVVERDLARAEPAVLEAQQSVSNIKRQHLTEVRSMGNPPAGVKLALESVCALLGHRVDSWKTIQGIVRRDDFIASIVNYDNERQMTPNLRAKMRNEFLSKEEFTFERVNRASKACGPLVQWVHAQVDFSEILDRVGPLREEVSQLEDQALQTKAEAKAIENTIVKLEDSISTYKSEYASLISETQSIKSEMSRVQLKVDRSVSLLDSLSQERGRWESGSKSFETQITTLIGDVLIAAAFLAYAGFYEQNSRKGLIDEWFHQLAESGIACKSNNPITEYLSNPDERLKWQHHSLPVDDLCTENAIILQRFNRYPLIIDPSGRTTEFLRNENKDRKLTVTSFLDDTFVKQLESALRFGNPILIQDAEHMDPILNHVLNKEYQKTGGRVLIQIGKQEIDFSPSFKLYMSTRDPSALFPPDVCSRVTFVNFTVTRSSLQTQSLNEVLKAERPDVDERRTNLVKLQGEFNTNLRRLERRLLQALNESRGNILDDDNVIETLERLKKEAQEISKKMEETEGVMAEVEEITQEYIGIAKACSAVFAVLEQLHQLNHSYQFSLQYFVDIFNYVLHDTGRLSGEQSVPSRCRIILGGIFTETYRRTSMSLLQKDRITLAMLLARASPFEMDRSVLEIVLDQKLKGVDISSSPESHRDGLALLSHKSLVQKRLQDISGDDWVKIANSERAEDYAVQLLDGKMSTVDQHLWSTLIMKLFKPDRVVPGAEKLVSSVFGQGFFDGADDLNTVVKQVTASTPIALDSSPGFDASYKVDWLVQSTKSVCANIAMGSSEGVAAADKAISNAAANGTWVLVKNVQLAPIWLQSLEKRLGALRPHPDFRLFLSMESSPKIPANLIRACRMLKYEQAAGIRANMKDSISSLAIKANKPPVEKARLYLLLSFLHAVVQERLRYVPTLGWKGFWEFNDSDYDCCAVIIEKLVDSEAQGRTNVPPAKLPWDLLRQLISEMYGGKIDDEGDRQILDQLVVQVFTVAAFEDEHRLARGPSEGGEDGGQDLHVPTGRTMQDFSAWVSRLPEREPPTYLGLPLDAEKLLLVGRGRRMVEDVERIADLLDEEEQLAGTATH